MDAIARIHNTKIVMIVSSAWSGKVSSDLNSQIQNSFTSRRGSSKKASLTFLVEGLRVKKKEKKRRKDLM